MTTPKKADIRLNLSPDRRGLSIEFGSDAEKLVGFALEAPEVDRLISLLAAARAEMAEKVPARLDPGSRVPATVGPAWQASSTTADTRGVMLRHPGLGWLGFVLPLDEARALAARLGAPAEARAPIVSLNEPAQR